MSLGVFYVINVLKTFVNEKFNFQFVKKID